MGQRRGAMAWKSSRGHSCQGSLALPLRASPTFIQPGQRRTPGSTDGTDGADGEDEGSIQHTSRLVPGLQEELTWTSSFLHGRAPVCMPA